MRFNRQKRSSFRFRVLGYAAAAALVCSLLPISSISSDPDPGVELVAQASDFSREGNYQRAVDLASAALSKTQDKRTRGRAWFIIGYGRHHQKRYKDARAALLEASKLNDLLSYHGMYYGALTYREEGDLENAAKLFKRLITHSPPGDLEARAAMEILRCYRRLGQKDNAAQALETVRKLSWHDKVWDRELEYTKAWVRTEQGAFVEARGLLVTLWREHPESYWASEAERLLNQKSGKFLLPGEMSPFTDGDRIRRVEVLLDRRMPDEALAEIQPILARAVKDSPPGRVAGLYKLRGMAYMDNRDFTNAIADFGRARSLSSADEIELKYLTGRCYQRSGEHDKAIEIYREIWTSYSQSPYATRALYYAARLYKVNNKWDEADEVYSRLVSGYPHSTLRPESLFQLAWIKYLRRDYPAAKKYLEQVPRSSKDREFNARTLYWKAAVMRQLGDESGAFQAETAILGSYWDSPYAVYLLTLKGKQWPYGHVVKVIPQPDPREPLEYSIAKELVAAGALDEADGQLDSLDDMGKMPEWLAWRVVALYIQTGDYYRSQRVAYRKLRGRLSVPPPGEAEAWRAAYPRAFQETVEKYSTEFKLDPLLVYSVMRAESTYRPAIRSSAGALGLMQVMPTTGSAIAKALGDKGFKKDNLTDPETNIRYGCYYLSQRLRQFASEPGPRGWLTAVSKSLASYNAGPHRVTGWAERTDALGLDPAAFIEEIPITETRDYVKKILKYYLIYHYAYAGASEEQTTAVETPPVVAPQPEPAATVETPPASGSTSEQPADSIDPEDDDNNVGPDVDLNRQE